MTRQGSVLVSSWGLMCAILVAGLALSGCRSAGSGDASLADGAAAVPAGGAAQPGDDPSGIRTTEILNIGDSLTIVYSDLPTPTPPFEGQIKADGTITLILNKTFQAAGKTRSELEKEIRDAYVPSYFRHMTATIKVKEESRLYYVGGQVRAPGRYPYLSRTTVLKAIQAAGDFTDFANRKKVKVTRSDGKTTVMVNTTKVLNGSLPDVEVFPGDSIYVYKKIF